MAYKSFTHELEAKADKLASLEFSEIQELDGKVLVEFFGDPQSPPGIGFCDCHGLSQAGVLTGDQAKAAGAADGHNIVVYE